MIDKDTSFKARDRYLEAYVEMLRKTVTGEPTSFNEKVIEVIANMYRNGWNDADDTFRSWEMMQ
jgi:hypothetical protein